MFLNYIKILFLIVFVMSFYCCDILCHVHHQRSVSSHLTHNKLEVLGVNKSNSKLSSRAVKVHKHQDICTEEAVCVPHVQCPAHVRAKTIQKCKAIGGRQGICCKTGQNHTEFLEEKSRGHHAISINPLTLRAVTKRSHSELAELKVKESRLLISGQSSILLPGSASYGHFRNSRTFNNAELRKVTDVYASAMEMIIATKTFKDREGITNDQIELGMIQEDLRPTPLGAACAPEPFCPYILPKYRQIDGACNNYIKTAWGTAMTPYSRLLPPSYQDGIWMQRVSVVNDEALPSPRLISSNIFSDNDLPNSDYTLLLMQFGQFMSHDITQSIDVSFPNGSAISCCSQDGSVELAYHFRHYSCMPITIPKDDYFYSTFNQGCMNFVRSVLAPRSDCTLGYAQQMNKVTHFIDASQVYGSTPEQIGELRSFEGGRLNVFNDFERDLLPLAKDSDACLTMEQGSACFTSGDTRTNQMISLVVMHTIFMREHNRLADELAELNPYWDDEKLFLEARQILMAEMQVIIYKEYLPAVIGDIAMEEFQLILGKDDEYVYDYDPRIEPSIMNEFASAAFRFGHSMVDGLLKMYGPNKMEEVIAIPEVMFYPARLRKRQFLDEMLTTLTTEPVQEVDNSISDALTKYMFRAGNPFGIDLVSLNIQRGRDHGLRPYNDYRELIGLPRIEDFSEFGQEIGEKLKMIYSAVDDIDLWVGGLLEEKAPGSIVGYTFRDIIADQFASLKKGDRYFFENHPDINPGYFTPEQLRELRKTSISRIICDNSDGILLGHLASNAFKNPSLPDNQFVSCVSTNIPKVNLIYWKE